MIFDAHDSSSSHTDNGKNNFLVLDEGPTDSINDSAGDAEKRFSVNFTIAKTKLCLSLHCEDSNLFVNRKKICKFKADDKHAIFPTQFRLRSISEKFDYA